MSQLYHLEQNAIQAYNSYNFHKGLSVNFSPMLRVDLRASYDFAYSILHHYSLIPLLRYNEGLSLCRRSRQQEASCDHYCTQTCALPLPCELCKMTDSDIP
jgi:hypothetical protein